MAVGTVIPGQIRTGPGKIYYAPLGTAIPTFTAAASKISGAWTTWIEVGATEGGMTYTEDTSVESIRVAESAYPVKRVTTEKDGSISFSMAHISDLNWKLAANGGTVATSGTGATKLNTFIPPLIGSELRVMLGFQSADDDEVLIWPQVFNGGSMEIVRGSLETMAVIPVEFGVELPDPVVLTTPYKRWTTGNLAQGV